MLAFIARTLVTAIALTAVSTGFFAWRWPAAWRLPVRPFGTTNQPSNDPATPASDDLAPPSPAIGWLLLVVVMAVLMAAWIALVLV